MIFRLTGRHCGRDPSIILTLKATACGIASTVAPIHIKDKIILNNENSFRLSNMLSKYILFRQNQPFKRPSLWAIMSACSSPWQRRSPLNISQIYLCPLFWCMVRQRIKYCLVPIDRNGSQGEYRSVYTYILKKKDCEKLPWS